MLAAISGSLLVLATPLDQALNGIPHRSEWSDKPPVSDRWMEQVRISLRAEYGDAARIVMRPPRRIEEPLLVRLKSPEWQGDLLYVNEEIQPFFKRSHDAGAWNLLSDFHSDLLLNDAGRALLSVSAVSGVVLLVIGWAMRAMRSRNRAALPKMLVLHRFVGVFAGAFIAIVLATGAYLDWKPLAGWVSSLVGQTKAPAPKLNAPQNQHLQVGDYVLAAARAMPGAKIGFIILPPQNSLEPVQIRKKLDGEAHPNGRSSVWLAPASAEVVAVSPWHNLDLGSRWHGWIYAFHSAQLWGVWHLVFILLSGMTLIALIYTGVLLWMKPRKRQFAL